MSILTSPRVRTEPPISQSIGHQVAEVSELQFPDPPGLFDMIERFVERCDREFGLPRKCFEPLVVDWCLELSRHFGTTPSFLDTLKYTPTVLPHTEGAPLNLPGVVLQFSNKRELQGAALRNYQEWMAQAGILLHSFSPERAAVLGEPDFPEQFSCCGGCQVVARQEMFGGIVNRNYVPDAGLYNHVNAFPWYPLGRMVTRRFHDDDTLRVKRAHQEEVGRWQEGFTLGSRPELKSLSALFDIADKDNLVALVNHEYSGASVPRHWHAQTFPVELAPGHVHRRASDVYRDVTGSHFDEHVFAVRSPYHPVDVLMVKGNTSGALADAVTKILDRCEDNGIVSTMSYHSRICFISIRETAEKQYVPIGIGARMNLCLFTQDELAPKGWTDLVLRHYPRYGTFDFQSLF